MTNELVEELGFILTKDDKTKKPLITFAEFLDKVYAPDKPEAQIIADAKRLERLLTYYELSGQVEEWGYTIDEFLRKVDTGAWEERFAA